MNDTFILFVDDEPLVVKVVRSIFERSGICHVTASGAAEAEALFDEHGDKITLLVTDVVMPQVNGRELCERLRAKRPSLPVIFVSGYVDDPELIETLGDSAQGPLLEKPFRPSDRLEAIQVAMDDVQERIGS